MARVFLSYDRRDGGKAEAIAEGLERAGHSVWWDRHIKGGRRFGEEIEQALAEADAVVVLWSAQSIESDWVKDEAAAGRDSNRLVPAVLDRSVAPLGFRQFQTIDLSDTAPRRHPGALSELLDAIDSLGSAAARPSRAVRRTSRQSRSRRTVLVGMGAVAAVGASGLAYWQLGGVNAPVDPKVAALLDQAWQSWSQGTSEGNSQAIGLYLRATESEPQYADTWGLLGCAYGDRGHYWVSGAERDSVWQRAQEAGRRAIHLEAHNAYGRAAIAYARPRRGNWTHMDRQFRQADQDQPGKWLILYSLGLLMGEVGRFAEAARLFGRLEGTAPTATQYHFHVQALWASGQLGDAERLLEEAVGIFGTYSGIWWQRFHMLLHGGRPTAAIAHLQDRGSRPADIDEQMLEQVVAVARASLSRDPAETQALAGGLREQASHSVLWAERSIQYASVLGAADLALEIAEALFFSRGFLVSDAPLSSGASPGEPRQVTLDDRRTRILFLPSTRPLREHAGFGRLVEDLGLNRYWQETNSEPDFRRR